MQPIRDFVQAIEYEPPTYGVPRPELERLRRLARTKGFRPPVRNSYETTATEPEA